MDSEMKFPSWHDLYIKLYDYIEPNECFHDFLKKKCGIELVFKGDQIQMIVKNEKLLCVAKLKYNIEV